MSDSSISVLGFCSAAAAILSSTNHANMTAKYEKAPREQGLNYKQVNGHVNTSSFNDVCNLMNGCTFPDFAFFLAGKPITVNSWPFGRPRFRRIRGIKIPRNSII